MTEPDVLCVGHASYDITMAVEHHPGPDEKISARAMTCGGGGPAANATVAVARLGGRSAFAGFLSSDAFGQSHLDELQAESVDTRLVVRGDAASPVSTILAKPDSARTVVNHKQDTPWLTPDHVDLSELKPKAILFDGHEPLISLPLAEQAKQKNIPLILDAGSAHRGSRELVPLMDYLVASKKFALDFTGENNPHAALEKLANIAPNAVITLGEDGLIWAQGETRGELAAFDVPVVDSTGAGDAFHGAFALGIAQDMIWDRLLRFASAAAALCCTRLGARNGIPSLSDVDALLSEQ